MSNTGVQQSVGLILKQGQSKKANVFLFIHLFISIFNERWNILIQE